MEKKEPIFVKYDEATREWFSTRPGAQTTVMCCEKCGLWYKPDLGHKCILRKIRKKFNVTEEIL